MEEEALLQPALHKREETTSGFDFRRLTALWKELMEDKDSVMKGYVESLVNHPDSTLALSNSLRGFADVAKCVIEVDKQGQGKKHCTIWLFMYVSITCRQFIVSDH